MNVIPAQIRAARAMLSLTQSEVAARAKVSKRTIVNIESDQVQPIKATLAAVVKTFEEAGIVFTELRTATGKGCGSQGARTIKRGIPREVRLG